MKGESLDGLKRAFEDWRSKKQHLREAIPADLLERARTAARRHGPVAVARATKVDRKRLKTGFGIKRGGTRVPTDPVPLFSRMEIAVPASAPPPFAEVEMPTGLKLRLFTQTEPTLALIASLCGRGGVR
jgi:hypothetical protein